MGLKSRITAAEEPAAAGLGDSRLVATYRAKLLEEIDLADDLDHLRYG